MMLYRVFCCLGLSAFFLLSLATVASASVQKSLPDFEPNGGFSIHLKKGSAWQKIGFLRFDEFFREKGLNVSGEEGELHLRLVKEGKGVAHIDRVLLNGKGALSVKGLFDPSPLGKLKGKDFDVVHFPEGVAGVELTFSGGGELLLAARVEGERLDETPFRFPQANQNQGSTSIGNFYSYTPSTQPTMVFAEGTAPGTGHPWGRTSVLAQVRGDRLELALDFEADNTLDGGKDYASLHVRSGEIIKTYTVSQHQQQWGVPYFTYTPGVPWQHKVYRFSLPLAEFQTELEKTLQLAFSAYGTAGPGPYSPVLAYGQENNEYLVVSHLISPNGDSTIQSRVYIPAGTEVGTSVDVSDKTAMSKTEPAVAYDSVNNRFLTLWVQDYGGVTYVRRQLVSAANSFVADPVTEPGGAVNQRYPAASFSSVSNRYLMAWREDTVATSWDIKGRLIDPNDNYELSGVIDICSESGSQDSARIAYNPTNDFFLVVWDDTRNQATSSTDIYGRLVKADGTLLGISTSISSAPGSQNKPDIAFDPERNRSLVVWQDSRNNGTTGEDVYGIFVGNGLVQQGDELVISTGAGDQWEPQVAYAGNGRFLVVWEDRASTYNELHGRWLDSNGEMLSEEQVFVRLDDGEVSQPRLAGDGKGNFLSVYGSATISEGLQIGTKKIVTPSFSRLFLLGLPAQLNGANK